MNLNPGFFFNEDTGWVIDLADEGLCPSCQGWVLPDYDRLPEGYFEIGLGPRRQLRSGSTLVTVDGVRLAGAYAVSVPSDGAPLGDPRDGGWACVTTQDGRGYLRACRECRDRRAGTVVLGQIQVTLTRPMEEAVQDIRDGSHTFDLLGIDPR